MLTTEQIENVAAEVIQGIAPEYHAELVKETRRRYHGPADDTAAVIDLMQNVAATRHYPTR
ncbi:hypothetical protein ACTXML_16005 [Glutamicibacter arilaitensis]|uniref:hypothetical protein n=1 Tax=Glutamicibacter arilaitensis TaxID=256701 RepID=UPI003FD58D3E